jgi:hypothetical protein
MIVKESKVVRKDMPGHSEFQNYGYVEGYFLTIDDLAKLIMDYGRDRENDNMIGLDTATEPYLVRWLKDHNQIVKK